MDQVKDVYNKPKKCYQRCQFQSEYLTVTTAAYPNQNTFENGDEVCMVIIKLDRICKDSFKFIIFKKFYSKQLESFTNPAFCDLVQSQVKDEIFEKNFTRRNPDKTIDEKLSKFAFTYTRDNIVKIKVFFRDPYYTNIVKDVSMTMSSFIGNTGGLLGLCTGMSLVSLFEIFYYLAKVVSCYGRWSNSVEIQDPIGG